MGPNSVRLVEELLIKNPDAITGGTVLDLGCGKALTSVYIANETNAKTVYAFLQQKTGKQYRSGSLRIK